MQEKLTKPIDQLRLSHLCEPRRLAAAMGRCLLTAALMSVALGGLAFLAESTYVSNTISVREYTAPYALNVVTWSIFPMLFIALQLEFQLLFVLSLHRSWGTCQIVFPILAGAIGGFLGWFLFPQPEHGPKETMLIAGAALTLYTGVSLQLALWSMVPETRPEGAQFPRTWFSVMVLLSATFLGALRGWTDDHPQLKRLLEYRAHHWLEVEHPPLPAPEEIDTIVAY
jgi:hypothetical protein